MKDNNSFNPTNDTSFKDKNKHHAIKSAGIYFAFWIFSIAVFWIFRQIDAMLYTLAFLWLIMPAATIALCISVGKNNVFGKGKGLVCVALGGMYMLLEYFTFGLANVGNALGTFRVPEWGMLVVGTAIAFVGLAVGCRIRKRRLKAGRK